MTAPYDTLSTEALLEALEKAGRTPDRDLLTVCLGWRDDLVPGLLEILRSGVDDEWENDDPRWYREVHAGLLLITFREERALPSSLIFFATRNVKICLNGLNQTDSLIMARSPLIC